MKNLNNNQVIMYISANAFLLSSRRLRVHLRMAVCLSVCWIIHDGCEWFSINFWLSMPQNKKQLITF